MRLNEITNNTETDNQFFTNEENIVAWLKTYDIKKYEIYKDLSVYVSQDVDIYEEYDLEFLPIRFYTVNGKFNIYDCNLTTLEGFPQTVTGLVNVGRNNLRNLNYMPAFVGGTIYCQDQRGYLETFHNIHRYLKRMAGTGIFYMATEEETENFDPLPTDMLSLFFVKGLEVIRSDYPDFDNIFNFYLDRHDIHGCQEALIEAGYNMQARV